MRGILPSQHTTGEPLVEGTSISKRCLCKIDSKNSSPPIGVRGQSSLLLRQSLQPLSQSREKTTQFHKLAFIQAGPRGVKISIGLLLDGVTQRLPLPGDPVCPRHIRFFHPSSSEQFLDRFFVICGCVPSKSSLLGELGRGSHLAGCGSCWPSRSKRGPPPCAFSLMRVEPPSRFATKEYRLF